MDRVLSVPQFENQNSAKYRKKTVLDLGSTNAVPVESTFSQFLFPGLPDHYPLRKKIQITKQTSTGGMVWDILQIVLAVLSCIQYVIETYMTDYESAVCFKYIELVFTQFFAIDFILNWYISSSWRFLIDPLTIVDVLTILPVYLTLLTGEQSTNLGFLRFVRILRLIRVFRTFKALRNMNGIRRQMLSLSLTLLCMTFLAAGLVQLMENDVYQYNLDCQFINAATNYKPSCWSDAPADEPPPNSNLNCDCDENNCIGFYQRFDANHEPSGIRCITLTYFNAYYFIIVTVATVGYGDISPTTFYSRIVILFFIVASLIIIPMQINKLQVLLSLRSPYRNPYKVNPHENHVILCGCVNDKNKLEKFFKEFFHPDRTFSSGPEMHAVVLSPIEPSEDVRSLLSSAMLDQRVTYVVGSALVVEDLKKVRADVASGMFFLCNTEVISTSANLEDAATVMRALSVSNFNPELDCLVQVLRPEDRTILKDSDVDVILCLDEFKTALQARNAICPGFSTFVENIFHSFGSVSPLLESRMDPWYHEYLHGARMEMYYVPLDHDFLEAMEYKFERVCEAILLQFEIIVMGLCSTDQDEMIFNPTKKDMLSKCSSWKDFFMQYNVALIIADDQMEAEQVARGLSDVNVVNFMIQKMKEEENNFRVAIKRSKLKPKPVPRLSALIRGHSFQLKLLTPGTNNGGNTSPTKLFLGAAAHLSKIAAANNTEEEEENDSGSDNSSDSEDCQNENYYPGYVQRKDEEDATPTIGTGRKMSVLGGGGGMMASQAKHVNKSRQAPIALVNARNKPPPSPVISAPNDKSSPANRGRKTFDGTQSKVDEEDDEEEEAVAPLPTRRTFGAVANLQSTADPTPSTEGRRDTPVPKAKPRPMLRAGTMGDTSKVVRKTLKEMHSNTVSNISVDTEKTAKTGSSPSSGNSEEKKNIDRTISATASIISVAEQAKKEQEESDEEEDCMSYPGCRSKEVKDYIPLKNHIIVFGDDANVAMFVSELRRPSVLGDTYHPIVIVSPTMPSKWEAIRSRYNDVYLVIGILTRSAIFKKACVETAFAVILLAARDGVTKVEEENIDSSTLFTYLKLEQYIPRDVFFSLELTCASNMAVLNATIMRRVKRLPHPEMNRMSTAKSVARLQPSLHAVNMAKNAQDDGKKDKSASGSPSPSGTKPLESAKPSGNGTPPPSPVVTTSKVPGVQTIDEDAEEAPGTGSEGVLGSRVRGDSGDNIVLTKLEDGSHLGRFTSKRSTIRANGPGGQVQVRTHGSVARAPSMIGKRLSTVDVHIETPATATVQELNSEESRFWDATDTHHMLPVFASARAYVPSSFESLLVQSFFGVLTPLICEKLVCGQGNQTIMQVEIPIKLQGKRFIDVVRVFSFHRIICFGIYRAPQQKLRAVLPYVYISPTTNTIVNANDRVFLYGNPSRVTKALTHCDVLTQW